MSVPDITTPEAQHSLETSPLSETRQLVSAPAQFVPDATIDALNTPSSDNRYSMESEPEPSRSKRVRLLRLVGISLLVIGLLTAGVLALRRAGQSHQTVGVDGVTLKPQTTSLSTLNEQLTARPTSTILTVNGQLAVNSSLQLVPSTQPTNATAGQLYYDKDTNTVRYYNGSTFVYLQGGSVTNISNSTTIGGSTTNITSIGGGGLGGSGTAGTLALFTGGISLGNSVIRQNGSALTVGGAATFAAGANSATALQVQNTSGLAVFTVNTASNVAVLGTDGPSPTATTLRGGAGVGNNISGANLVIAGSNGTGSANGGDIIFQTGQSPQGGIQLDNAQQASSNGSTVSMTFTVGTQKDRLLVVSTDWATSSVTYNGRPLTSLASIASAQHFGNGTYMEMWYLVNPPSGTFALTATAGGGGTAMGAASYYNVNQTTPFASSATATNSGDGPTSLTLTTSNTSQIVVDGMSIDRDASSQSCTPTTTQTVRWAEVQQFFHVGCGGDSAANGGVMNLGWAVTAADWVDVGAVVNPAVAGSTPLQQIGGSTPDTLFDRLHITATGNVGINNSNPQYALDVSGVSSASTAMYAPVFDTAGVGTLAIGNLNATSIQLGNTSSNIATSILGTVVIKPTPGNDSTASFQIQDAGSAPLLTADTANTTITIAGSTNFAVLNLSNTHLASTQTTPPTIATPTNCGTGPTASVTAGSTDTAGSFSIVAGSGAPTTCATAITFNKPYGAAPKSIITMPTVAVGGATNSITARIASADATSFTVEFAPVNATAGTTYSFYYIVVQ